MKTTLRFTPGGYIDCLHTEVIDLRALGRLHVARATDICFRDTTQEWEVHDADTGTVLFTHSSREQCLHWEHLNLQPQASS